MFRQRGLRLGLASLISVVMLGGLAFAAPASAADTTADVTIHARLCPDTTLTDLFADCHGNPMLGQKFRIDGRTSKPVNVRGNVAFHDVAPGSYVVALSSGTQPGNGYDLRAFCSDQNGDRVAREVRVRYTAQASFRLNLSAGQNIVCDVYWIPS